MKKYFKNMNKHNENLSRFAAKDSEAIRIMPIELDFRPPYFRDIDKIIYSPSYFRYMDKTQVYSFESNDMISKRMTHIQLVSKIARTIGRGLNLNEDLIEAASLGHDLGHTPFGHVGEKFLNNLSIKHNEGYFNHNVQSVRTLMYIENYGKGNNITIQVLDAILCHNGEELKQKYIPRLKTQEEFLEEYNKCYSDEKILKNVRAMTLEGCVVRISDVIAYLGKDIEDAIRLKKISVFDIPDDIKEVLGIKNSEIINTIVVDIIENSFEKGYIKISKKIYDAMKQLMKFNYEKIYSKANTDSQILELENMFNSLFDLYYSQVSNNEIDSDVYKDFLSNMSKQYIDNNTTARKVIDYIAGMTDGYFISQYKKYF